MENEYKQLSEQYTNVGFSVGGIICSTISCHGLCLNYETLKNHYKAVQPQIMTFSRLQRLEKAYELREKHTDLV